jgi:hypothetical protein
MADNKVYNLTFQVDEDVIREALTNDGELVLVDKKYLEGIQNDLNVLHGLLIRERSIRRRHKIVDMAAYAVLSTANDLYEIIAGSTKPDGSSVNYFVGRAKNYSETGE